MRMKASPEQDTVANFFNITKAQAVRIIETLVLVHGIVVFTKGLRQRQFLSFACIPHFAYDELYEGVEVALAMAAKMRLNKKIPRILDYELEQVFGNASREIIYKIDNGAWQKFDQAAAAL